MNAVAVRWRSEAGDDLARAGWLATPHGDVPTPCFMAVATSGGLKGVTAGQARTAGQGVLLANTYHLALRPGAETVHRLGGLHVFCGWSGPMLTDSGGYQVFSLSDRRVLTEEGVRFASHLDGRSLLLTPEESIRLQRLLGADIIMAFDECPPADAPAETVAAAVERTARWLTRSVTAWRGDGALPGGQATQALYGIVQGGSDLGLRRRSLDLTLAHDLPGYALGGLAVGETPEARQTVLAAIAPLLPADRPRYLMGVGTPLDLVQAIACGLDQFDCVLPTRMGRHGIAYTDAGPLHLKRAQYTEDRAPIDAETPSEASSVPRGAIRHLLSVGEPLGGILLSIHNLAYYNRLMGRCRTAITAGRYAAFAGDFTRRYRAEGADL